MANRITIVNGQRKKDIDPEKINTWIRLGWTEANTAPTTITITDSFAESEKNEEIPADVTTEAELEEEQDQTFNQAETREF